MTEGEQSKPFKLLIIGESKVGKSSLRNHLLGRPIRSGKYRNSNNIIDVFDTNLDDELTIMMYDIADIDQLKQDVELQETYLKNTHMVLIMFAIDEETSFMQIPELLTMVINQNRPHLIPFAIIGNKKDLRLKGTNFVSYQKAKKYADKLATWAGIEIPYFDISLKLNEGIEPIRKFINRKQIIKTNGEIISYGKS